MKITTENKKSIEVSDSTFSAPFNEALVHQVVNAVLSGARSGTKAQKNRSQVSGGGAKPWRQKGTGRARAGTIRSPIWVGGGRAFAARPRDFSQKVNKKMYRAAMRSILSELLREDRLVVLDKFDIKQPKTKEFKKLTKKLKADSALIVNDKFDENLFLSSRNIKNMEYSDVSSINPVSLMKYEKVIINVESLKIIEERLA
ncbi:MAG: 50S ribosomal protein L4 [Gammaproteobacteria bacterium]|nr:50S ribosomal protein L4 [Gammaproteobacteria bacterium]|tara:strand:+ start:137 stop:739 length:603 start_codon:yes stop_codon:yes gene_type:complete